MSGMQHAMIAMESGNLTVGTVTTSAGGSAINGYRAIGPTGSIAPAAFNGFNFTVFGDDSALAKFNITLQGLHAPLFINHVRVNGLFFDSSTAVVSAVNAGADTQWLWPTAAGLSAVASVAYPFLML